MNLFTTSLARTMFGMLMMLFCVTLPVVLQADDQQLSHVELNKVRKLLTNRCFTCHGPDEAERKADLRLDTFDHATMDREGAFAIKPGDVEASEVVARIIADDEFTRDASGRKRSTVDGR